MDQIATTFKALSDRNRLRILLLLSMRKMCVCELAHALDVTQPSISRHLKRLKQVALIGDEQDGYWTNYYLNCRQPQTSAVLDQVKQWLKNDPTVSNDKKRLEQFDRKGVCC